MNPTIQTAAFEYQGQVARLLQEEKPKNLLVVAPTGAGKTEAAMLAIERAERAIYVAPTRALCHEKARWLRERFPGKRVVIGNKDYSLTLGGFCGSEIRVLTPWKLGVILHNDPNFARHCPLVVIDEVQSLGQSSDMELIVTTLRQRHPEVQVVALSAVLHEEDKQKVASWLDAILVESSIRPVPLLPRVVHFDADLDQDGEEVTNLFVRENGKEAHAAWAQQGFMGPEERVVATIRYIRDEVGDHAPVLVYSPFRERARNIALKLAEEIGVYGCDLDAAAQGLPVEAGDYTDTIKGCLPKGIGLHHGGCTQQERELIFQLAFEGVLPVVVCCETLASGINLPARHVIVESVYVDSDEGDGTAVVRRLMSASHFWNLAGRAGRPQFDSVGFVWVLTDSELTLAEVEEVLLKQKASKIESRIYDEYFLTAHLAGLLQMGYSSPAKLIEFMRATYFGRTLQDEQPLLDQFERIIARLVEEGYAATIRGKLLVLTDRGHRLALLGMHPAEYAAIEALVGRENAEYEEWVRELLGVCGMHALRGKREPFEEEIAEAVSYGMTCYAVKTSWACRELVDYLSRLIELTFNFLKFNGVAGEFERAFKRDVADRFLFGEIEIARKLARVLPNTAVKRLLRNFGPGLHAVNPATGERLPIDDPTARNIARVLWEHSGLPSESVVGRVAGIIGMPEARFRRLVTTEKAMENKKEENK